MKIFHNYDKAARRTRIRHSAPQSAEVGTTPHAQIYNSPSQLWGSVLNARRAQAEEIEQKSLKWTCCQVKSEIKKNGQGSFLGRNLVSTIILKFIKVFSFF